MSYSNDTLYGSPPADWPSYLFASNSDNMTMPWSSVPSLEPGSPISDSSSTPDHEPATTATTSTTAAALTSIFTDFCDFSSPTSNHNLFPLVAPAADVSANSGLNVGVAAAVFAQQNTFWQLDNINTDIQHQQTIPSPPGSYTAALSPTHSSPDWPFDHRFLDDTSIPLPAGMITSPPPNSSFPLFISNNNNCGNDNVKLETDQLSRPAVDTLAHAARLAQNLVLHQQQQQQKQHETKSTKTKKMTGKDALSQLLGFDTSNLTKAERKKMRENTRNLTCFNCGTHRTPLWRRTADKRHSLCNACGLYFKQYQCHRPANVRHKDKPATMTTLTTTATPSTSTISAITINNTTVPASLPALQPSPVNTPIITTIAATPTPAAVVPAVPTTFTTTATTNPSTTARRASNASATSAPELHQIQPQSQTAMNPHAARFKHKVVQLPLADARRLLRTLEMQVAFVKDHIEAVAVEDAAAHAHVHALAPQCQEQQC
ncbi:hypothetical protein DFJ77DRAFT_236440 [Powellomyces hirtus]|nr:hypothetical protein DFJ77DRAFT_236440 [Powellomyces hirtus]